MAAKYKEHCRVADVNDGIQVELKLRKRLDVPPMPFFQLSWRTRYATSPDKSRRYYHSPKNAGFWTISVSVALSLLRQAEDRGMLDFRYDDARFRDGTRLTTIIDSRSLNDSQQRQYHDAIICNKGEPDWGVSPLFMIRHSQWEWEGSREAWREIMIVDAEREFCTFRSTTTSVDYGMGIFADRLEKPWRLDNAMQDADPASMREFLRMLEKISQ